MLQSDEYDHQSYFSNASIDIIQATIQCVNVNDD